MDAANFGDTTARTVSKVTRTPPNILEHRERSSGDGRSLGGGVSSWRLDAGWDFATVTGLRSTGGSSRLISGTLSCIDQSPSKKVAKISAIVLIAPLLERGLYHTLAYVPYSSLCLAALGAVGTR